MVLGMAGGVEDGWVEVDGVETFYRRVPGEGTSTVYVHGNPTHSGDWLPFLERGGAALAIDLPGWGRTEKPAGFDHTMHSLSAFHERALAELGIGPRRLVVHDWGALALIGAQRRPDLVERLVAIDAVPLLPGYRWHWVAQLWRRRPLGELLNATATRASLALLMRQARGDYSPMSDPFVEMVWEHWDAGTQAAILALYRDADPAVLAVAGRDLGRLDCPALVLWGERDRYLPLRFGAAYAQALPGGRLEVVRGAGHWPWIEEPAVVDRVLEFLA
jgi:pimeloyl-ACP methyl ester carboxylesterase